MQQSNMLLSLLAFFLFFPSGLFSATIDSNPFEEITLTLVSDKPVEKLPEIASQNDNGESDESVSFFSDLNFDPDTDINELSLRLSFLPAPAEGTMPLIAIGDQITITQVAVNLIKVLDYYAPLLLELNLSDNRYDYLKDLKDNGLYIYFKYMEPAGRHIKRSFAEFTDDKNVEENRRWAAVPWFAIISTPNILWDGICATIKEGPQTVGRQFLVPYRLGYKTLIEGDNQGSQRILIDGYANSIAANGSVAGVFGLSQVGAKILLGGKNLLGNLSPNAVELAGNNGINISGIAGSAAAAEGSCVALGGISGDMLRTGGSAFFAATSERSTGKISANEFDMEDFIDRLEFIHGKGTYVEVTLEDGTTHYALCIDILRPNPRNAMLVIRENGSHELTSIPFQVIKHAEVRLGSPLIKPGMPVKIWFKRGRSATGTYLGENAKEVQIRFMKGEKPMIIPKGDLLLQLTRQAEL